MMLAAQDKLIETLSGQHEPKVPEILMKGFSICPRCGIEALTHYPDRTIWCANCNLRSVWKMERVPLCPHCRAISLSFHPSGKARCLFCTFEFRYKPGIEGEHKGEKDPFVPVREILQKGQSEMKEWVRETESQRTGTREIMRPIRGGPEEEKTPFMLSEDERKGLKRAGRGDPAEGEWESLEKLARSLEDDIGKAGRKGLNIEHMWSDYDIGYGYLGSGDLTVARDIFSRLKLELYRMLSESKEPAEKDAEIVYSDETIPGDVDDITSENGETPAGDRKGMETAGMDEDEAAVEVLEYKEDEEPGEALETADQGEPAEASMDARSAPVRKKTKRVKREAAPRRAEYEERSLQCPICMIPVGRDEEICPVCGVFVSEVKDRERTKPLPPLEQMRPRVSREKLRSIMGRDGIEHTGARSPSGHPRIYGRSDSRPVRKTKGGLGKIEKKIGTLILLVVGILIVTTGLVFLGMLSWSKIGNNGKIAIIFIFAALLAGAAEWLYRRNKMLTFSKGLSTLSFLAAYTGAGVMYYYDYSFTLIIAAGMIIILLNIAASYRYQMYLLIGVSIIASYILATMMRMSKTDAGEPLISAPVYAGLLVGIAALFTAASYLVFNRTKSSKMAYITSIVSNIWLIAFNGQMNDEVLISGSIIMLLTALLATGTSKIGFGQVKDRKSRITGRASKKATRMSHRDFQKLEKERKKLLHFQYLWYGSLLLSLLVCIMVSARNIASISIGSLEVHWGGVMFFMALLTYAVSALYLGNELRAPWIFSAITFAAGIAAGLFLGTFWPVAISFLLANSLLLIWKRRRFLYYGSLMASLVLCVLVSAEGTRSIPMGSYDLPWTSFLFMAVLLAFAVHSMNMGRTIRHSYLYSVLTFAAGLASGF